MAKSIGSMFWLTGMNVVKVKRLLESRASEGVYSRFKKDQMTIAN